MSPRTLRSLALAALVGAALAAAPARAAIITIVNADTAGEGFNDPTAVAPVGGNAGTTLGQQRLNVFQAAASVWAGLLTSNVTIQVQATFDPLTCSATSGVLGSAGTQQIFRDFSGAEWTGTWYPGALANRRAGSDLSPSSADISARFNRDVDNATCLGAASWYYGLDGAAGTNVDLFPVVLHELGHGLGFATFMSTSTGALASGFPDTYNRFLRDMNTNALWPSLTNGQRQTAAISPLNEVWDGPAVSTRAWTKLRMRPELTVSAPAGIAGTYAAGVATFGPAPGSPNVTAPVVLVNDGSGTTSDGCTAFVNGAAISGKIAFLDRGTCNFNQKALNAQAAGAVGVILADNVAASTPPQMSGTAPTLTIPIVSVTQALGNTIRAQLGGGVTATIRANPFRLVGAHDNGKVLVYTPNPLVSGSSVSHFDVTAVPNLLMEPALNSDLLHGDVDLTLDAFQDIGWFIPRAITTTPLSSGSIALASAPNPFADRTSLRFSLAQGGFTDVSLYDVEGRLVARLAHQWMPAGAYELPWDGTGRGGARAPAGVYLARVKTGEESRSHRIVLVD